MFNIDIWVKMVSFQIMQNALNVKTTQLVEYNSQSTSYLDQKMLLKASSLPSERIL